MNKVMDLMSNFELELTALLNKYNGQVPPAFIIGILELHHDSIKFQILNNLEQQKMEAMTESQILKEHNVHPN